MTTPVTELDLPELPYTDPALTGERFHATLAALRERSWLARSPLATFVLDREAGEQVLRSKRAAFPGRELATLFDIREGPLAEEVERNILHLDGAEHRRLRNLVNPSFTPRAADRWRPEMRRVLADLVEPGEQDLVATLCAPYPSRVIATVMGAPEADAPRLAEWSQWIQRQFDAPSLVADRARIERAVAEFYAYAEALLAERRAEAEPRDDLIGHLLAAGLEERELVNLVLNVLVGGVDTTQSQLAHAVRLLAQDPDQYERLRADPDGVAPRAVEEALRVEPITPFTARIVREELTVRDVTFPPGTILMVAAASANRDDVPDGARFDLDREAAPARSLTFGAGIHYCLGANLARAELGEALAHLARRFVRIELAGEPVHGSITGIYGLESLPVRLVAPA